jgi:hypothetical protein
MTHRIGEPAPCPSTANGLHHAGDRCDACYHRHCASCARCVNCERYDGVSCKFRPFRGAQGRQPLRQR